MAKRQLNVWDGPQVKRAETTWGHKFPEYTVHLFNSAIDEAKNHHKYLDLGCGFGRFLEFLDNSLYNFEYIGYDSSAEMLDRITERFPDRKAGFFHENVTNPILPDHLDPNLVVISSAVLIHITVEDQNRILGNIKMARPKMFGFDINCWPSKLLHGNDHVERVMQPGFRMTWQDGEMFSNMLSEKFNGIYQIEQTDFDLRANRFKRVYIMRRIDEA
jgi:SAM-dependent methyltransferase